MKAFLRKTIRSAYERVARWLTRKRKLVRRHPARAAGYLLRCLVVQLVSVMLSFFIMSELVHTLNQFLVIIFTLTSANNLANTRNKKVHSRYRLIIRIHLHIESFNLLWIIGNKHRAFKYLFCQITLVFCLKIGSPMNFVFKLVIILSLFPLPILDFSCFRLLLPLYFIF